MTRIFCTGGAGFIGSNTVNLLVKNHHKVVVVDNFSSGHTENLKGFHGRIFPCDITDFELLEHIFSEFMPEAVLHLAAQSAISTALDNPQYDMRINGIGTLNVLNLSKKYGVGRFVFSSSSAVYKESNPLFGVGMNEQWAIEPGSPYGISKLAAEQYIRTMFPNHMILRYANVYGPRQRSIGENQVIARAFSYFINGSDGIDFKVTGHGNQKRDFVYVDDIAYCNLEALRSNVVGTFNAASGRSYSVNQVLSEIEQIYDVPGYKWTHTKHNDPRGDVYLNASSIRRKIGWNAEMGLSDGLKLTSEWWEENK